MADSSQTVNLVQALIPPFAAGFVVQRALEILDPISPGSAQNPNRKKIMTGIVSLVIGWALACSGIRVFLPLGAKFSKWEDIFLTGVFISAGTEGFNTLLKFATYKKEASKAEATEKESEAAQRLQLTNKQS